MIVKIETNVVKAIFSELSHQSLDKEFACNKNDASIQYSNGHGGAGYNGEGYKKSLCFEGESVDSDGEINDNASKRLDDYTNP